MEPNTSKKGNIDIWYEKYRPQTMKDVLLPTTFRRYFNKHLKDGIVPNLLLYSSTPGSGKTTVAKAMCNDLDVRYLYLNISDEGGIDVLRTKIKQFASIKSIKKKSKCVILDEFDGATMNLQKALRASIEENHERCRFVVTCNYINKIIPALRSGRLVEFDFNMKEKKTASAMKKKVHDRMCEILTHEEVKYDESVVADLVIKHFPNNRKIITILQKYAMMNGVIDTNIFNMNEVGIDFFELIINKKFDQARKYAIENSYDYEDMYTILYHDYVPLLSKPHIPQAIVIIAEYMYKHSFSIDPEITFSALLVELMSIE